MKSSRAVAVIGGLLAVGLLFGAARGLFVQRERPVRSLVNQLWVQRMPRDERDRVKQLVVLDPQAVGVTARASRWRAEIDGFRWRWDGDDLLMHYPQFDRGLRVRARAWACADEAPKPFELCLELARGDERLVLYSREDWRVRSDGSVEGADGLGAAPRAAALLPAEDAPLPSGSESGSGAPLFD